MVVGVWPAVVAIGGCVEYPSRIGFRSSVVCLTAATVTWGSTVEEVCAAAGVDLRPEWQILRPLNMVVMVSLIEALPPSQLEFPCGQAVLDSLWKLQSGACYRGHRRSK